MLLWMGGFPYSTAPTLMIRCSNSRRHHPSPLLSSGILVSPVQIRVRFSAVVTAHLNAPAKARAVYSPRLSPQATLAAATASWTAPNAHAALK
jgi:hypothetical protein